MKRYLMAFTLITQLTIAHAQSPCSNVANPALMRDCYITAYQKLEQKMGLIQREILKVLPSQDKRQMLKAVGAWRNYMTEQCEFESRMYPEQSFRGISIAICRYRMLDKYLRDIAYAIKQYQAINAPQSTRELPE